MEFLHTMIRVADLDGALDFFCNKLGLREVKRINSEQGRYTLVYLATPTDMARAEGRESPWLELTYNWPDENGKGETYTGGRNFGHVAYQVDDIYATCQRLMDAGITINRPPRDGYMAFIKSPDGISIELLQKGKALAPQDPWLSMANEGTW